jgi:hypothetical protein
MISCDICRRQATDEEAAVTGWGRVSQTVQSCANMKRVYEGDPPDVDVRCFRVCSRACLARGLLRPSGWSALSAPGFVALGSMAILLLSRACLTITEGEYRTAYGFIVVVIQLTFASALGSGAVVHGFARWACWERAGEIIARRGEEQRD